MKTTIAILMIMAIAGCATSTDGRPNAFSPQRNAITCPSDQRVVRDIRVGDDSWGCVDEEDFEVEEMVSYDD